MQQDPSLHDEQLEDEIELVSELVLAASQTEGRLSEQAIDEVLGVDVPAGAEEPARAFARGRHGGLEVWVPGDPATRHPRVGPSL